MGILDKLKRKKSVPPEAALAGKPAEKTVVIEEPAKKPVPLLRASSSNAGRAFEILVRPVLSEKATHLANRGTYVFEVDPKANKSEIKKSVQAVYKVHVEGVRIIKMPAKTRRYGRSTGKTSVWKKAVVTVKKGEKISGIVEAIG